MSHISGLPVSTSINYFLGIEVIITNQFMHCLQVVIHLEAIDDGLVKMYSTFGFTEVYRFDYEDEDDPKEGAFMWLFPQASTTRALSLPASSVSRPRSWMIHQRSAIKSVGNVDRTRSTYLKKLFRKGCMDALTQRGILRLMTTKSMPKLYTSTIA